MAILVSVPVVTYNAAVFIEETLESIFNQTYKEIELIISDDCSKDATLALVENWCNQPRVKERFTAIKIIKVPKNTGVSANCNRAIVASSSNWIKFIAGDDILLPNCIQDNMNFVAENSSANIIFSQVKVYQDTFEEFNFQKCIPSKFPFNLMDEHFSANDQFNILLDSDRITYTPSYFFNKQTILSVGGYDEENKLVEDYPMWLKLTKAGEKLYYFHKKTVGYRIHSNATNNSGQDVLIKPSVINGYLVRKKFAHPHLPKRLVLQENWVYRMALLFKKMGITKKTKATQILYRISTVYANPFFYYNTLLNKIS